MWSYLNKLIIHIFSNIYIFIHSSRKKGRTIIHSISYPLNPFAMLQSPIEPTNPSNSSDIIWERERTTFSIKRFLISLNSFRFKTRNAELHTRTKKIFCCGNQTYATSNYTICLYPLKLRMSVRVAWIRALSCTTLYSEYVYRSTCVNGPDTIWANMCEWRTWHKYLSQLPYHLPQHQRLRWCRGIYGVFSTHVWIVRTLDAWCPSAYLFVRPSIVTSSCSGTFVSSVGVLHGAFYTMYIRLSLPILSIEYFSIKRWWSLTWCIFI